MTAHELSSRFLLWFQKTYPDARCHRNNRGIAKRGREVIRFGIPAPTGKGKNEKLKGSDFISFHPEYTGDSQLLCISKFWEIKTASDVLMEGQINFLNQMTEMGAECFVIKESQYADFEIEKWEIK